MDMISILNGLKNKVLDAKNYDILKHTYELQEENIKQLKTSNEAIKDNNILLQEKVVQLKKDNELLIKNVEELKKKILQFNEEQINSGLSKVAIAVLNVFVRLDKIELWKETDIFPSLEFSQIQVATAIDELLNKKLLIQSRAGTGFERQFNPMGKTGYALTKSGKSYLDQNNI